MAVELVSETFQPHVGETFTIAAPGGAPFEAVLLDCEETPFGEREELRAELGRVPFSLVFRAADRDRYWPQQIFIVEHPELGELQLFLVPLGPDESGMRYEAVVS